MAEFLQQLINGISLGSVYALVALGYTMVYGIVRLINFAHGDVYMVGAFAGYFAIKTFKLPFFAALVAAMAVCAILGVIMERIAYKPLRNAPRVAALMTAVGLSMFYQNFTIYRIGAQPKAFPKIAQVNWQFAGVTVSNSQVLILGTAIALMIILHFVVQHTKMGKAMRAVSQDRDAAMLMGINVDNTISFTFAIGSALAAAGGVLVGQYYGVVQPLMGALPGLKAFVAAVLGGIGIIPGAMIGGLILGVAEAGVSAVGFSTYRDAVAFGILILILIVKPAGILGKNVREKV
ncbi:amino acid/amide ABC transporter membrane protein 1, HAAT family (TC 3.A.1.4.-) [Geosporobacter subterraneus DSM 17957]|uniref:Amino acid/amide ABC transporter membrane protein 1, HAAT family (TC 3.A.1.4.-) n=1 Tax=Geosporobacter subterraneus DSM 17957 TaxID=1121919 RepID=A0A1M6PK18_9FIRM|nr:branched-chain amino acid ABC transporter permease [Geosporobacter subterraneus]SHK08269.1 amino acid/amide ABC transporter membrane protein 1, HAAT family (TC 3.A.1.4.-) [Geosporobacter subterraneus DSM 17957]